MNYIKRMRDLREDRDKTQQEIARVLGTSQTMYARYERGPTSCPSAIWSPCAGITGSARTICWG